MKTLYTLLFVCILAGCGTLEPGGAYDGDKVLFATDQVIKANFDAMESFVTWEYKYRDSLPLEVTKHADYIRANVKLWHGSVFALRDAYAANPSPDNLDALEQILALMRAVLSEATKYLAASSNP